MTLIGEGIAILVCILISALFSGSETALASLGKRGPHVLLEDSPVRNRSLQLWVKDQRGVLTAILIGNNLSNITATALATDVSRRAMHSFMHNDDVATALGLAVGVMTFLILTFGEIIPKSLSQKFPERLAVPAMWWATIAYWVFYIPSKLVFVPMARLVERLAHRGGLHSSTSQLSAEAEIEYMVNIGRREGSLTSDKERLLHSVFEFSDTTVKEVMVPRVNMVAVEADTGFEELMRLLVECGHSRIPVYEGDVDHIVGMFYAKDIIKFLSKGGLADNFKLTNFTRDPVFVPASKKVEELFTEFKQRRIHIAVAVDEFGGTAGVVTLEDIIEEFFGEIQDEYDSEEPMLQVDEEGRAVADARIEIDELEEHLGMSFPDEHAYESLGGFVVEHCGSVPEAEEQLVYGGFRFTVVESEPTHVVSVRIEPTTGEHDEVDPDGEDDDDTAPRVSVG